MRYILVDRYGGAFMAIPRSYGALSFATLEEAQERADEINELGCYEETYRPEPDWFGEALTY